MQAGSVNASVLLASFLGNEHEKIGQDIARSDFAGELEKYCTPAKNEQKGAQSTEDPRSADQNTAARSSRKRKALTEDEGSLEKADKEKSSRTRSTRAAASKARIKDMKARAENGENIFITNPVLAESILTELHYPSETVKACKNLQNKDGWISIADFKALLANQPTAPSGQQSQALTPSGQPRISTAQVQALLGTIVQKLAKDASPANGTFESTQAQTTALPASSQTSGVCTVADIRSVIDQLLQNATAESTTDKSLTRAPIAPSSAASSAREVQIAGDVMMTPKQGQAENVTAATIPSFVSDDSTNEGQNGVNATASEIQARLKAATGQSGSPVTGTSENSRVVGTNKSRPNGYGSGQVSSAQSNSGSHATGSENAIHNNGIAPGVPGQEPAQDSGLSTTARNQSAQDLASLAKEFGARIVASGSDNASSSAKIPVSHAGTLEDTTLQNLDITRSGSADIRTDAARLSTGEAPPLEAQGFAGTNGLEIEKTARSDSEETMSATDVVTESTEDSRGLDPLRTSTTEGEADQQFPGYGQKRAEEQLQTYRDQMRSVRNSQDTTVPNENTDLTPDAEPTKKTPQGGNMSSRDATLGPNTMSGRDSLRNPGTQPDQESIIAELGSPVPEDTTAQLDAVHYEDTAGSDDTTKLVNTLETDVAEQNTIPPSARKKIPGTARVDTQSQTTSKTGSTVSERSLEGNRPSRADSAAAQIVRFPSSTNPVSSHHAGEESAATAQSADTTVAALTQQESATNLTSPIAEPADTTSQSATQVKTALHGHNASLVAKEMETQLKYNDTAQNSAAQQSFASTLQDTRIQMPGMAQSMTDGGLNNYYDPGRSVQIVESYREHLRSIGGRQLTLEMEHAEFGKMSVKVGARKDEVSAVITTENESTRQVLLKNSPELRQNLENQGLELGKFMVDVDRQNSGRQSGEWRSAESGDTGPEGKTVNSTEQPKTKPAYLNMNGRLSRVSLFA